MRLTEFSSQRDKNADESPNTIFPFSVSWYLWNVIKFLELSIV